MRKGIYQILFWFFYWAIVACLEFYWIKDNATGWDNNKILTRACIGAFLYILPLIALAYYLVFIGFKKIIQSERSVIKYAVIILIPYTIAICMVIVIVRLIVFPFVYDNVILPGKLFVDPRRFLSIVVEAAFPAGLLMSLKYVETQLEAKEQEKKLLKEKLSTELKFLKNQLNPHFLFNTLNNIYALTRKKSDKAPEVVMKLSELLSFMLYESNKETISLEREVKFLEDYISLEQIRHPDGLSVVFNKEIDNSLQQVAPLLLLPLVENAFKHGASENHFESFIHIHLKLEQQQLSFVVKNSFEESLDNNKVYNIGLSNINRQLELLYKEQKLKVVRTQSVFMVELQINLSSYGKN